MLQVGRCLNSLAVFQPNRLGICTTAALCKTQAGKYRSTKKRTRALTYEMAQRPHWIGVRKAWLSWHTGNLEGFGMDQAYRASEDETIRRLMRGIWFNLFVSELVIKRRGNIIAVVGIVQQTLSASKMYWLIGFTEELLSNLFAQPVKLEIQTVNHRDDIVFKYI